MRPWSHATLRRFLLSARLAPTTQAPSSTPSGDIPQAQATGTYDDAMTDRLENIDATAASPAPGTDGAISTPLPPKSLENGPDLKRQRILAVNGAIALLAAVVLALLWVSALSSRDTATTERDAAQAAATEEAERTADALDSLAATEVNLETALADNEQLTAELAAAEADAAEATAATARADEAEATLAVVRVENETLAAEITTLETSLSASQGATPAVVFDISTAPNLARYIGEQLSSSSRPTVLGDGQTTCLGTAVVNDIGLATLGSGLASGASTSESTAVVEAIERAAVSCSIDPSAIF